MLLCINALLRALRARAGGVRRAHTCCSEQHVDGPSVRYLVTVKSAEPHRRLDVLPVTLWDPENARIRA